MKRSKNRRKNTPTQQAPLLVEQARDPIEAIATQKSVTGGGVMTFSWSYTSRGPLGPYLVV